MLPPQELDVQNQRGLALCDHARVLGRAQGSDPQTVPDKRGRQRLQGGAVDVHDDIIDLHRPTASLRLAKGLLPA